MRTLRPIAVALPLAMCATAAVAVQAMTGCVSISYEKISSTGTQAQQVADAKGLSVESRNGTISVVRDESATEMQITAVIRCGGATKEEADKRLAESKIVTEKLSNGHVSVKVSSPPCANGKARASNDGANFEIRAASLNGINLATSNGTVKCEGFEGELNIRSSNGGIRVGNHNGPVQVDTSNGAVEATDVAGPVDLESSNGAISVKLADGSSQNVTVRSSNGSLNVALPAAWNGSMNAQTSNGQVTVRADPGRTTDVSTARGRCTATIGNGNANAQLRTSNGSVVITVRGAASGTPASPSADAAPIEEVPQSEAKATVQSKASM